MYLHDSIVWAIGPDGASGIIISCDDSQKEEIAGFFEETFSKYWSEAEDAVEDEYGDCCEKDEEYGSPATVTVEDNGVKVIFGALYLSYMGGDYLESEGFADKALEKTLKKHRKKYPGVSYEGYIAYHWSDVHCGDVTQYAISSGKTQADKIYDFVGEAIAMGMQDDEEFWEEMDNQLCDADADEFKQVLKTFHAYAKWVPEDAFDQLMDIADEIDEDIRPELEEIIEAWDNGEEVEIGDGEEMDTSNLPEGYMDALMAVINADNAKREAEIEAELAEEDEE